jgi:GPI-anchor transamidase subunit S
MNSRFQCSPDRRDIPHSFIVPRWGGIVIYNPPDDSPITLSSIALSQTFAIFRQQLLQLIGLPSLPTLRGSSKPHFEITDWQFDALLRRRLGENVRDSRDTLNSIMRLVSSLSNLPIGKSVQENVQASISALQKVYNRYDFFDPLAVKLMKLMMS